MSTWNCWTRIVVGALLVLSFGIQQQGNAVTISNGEFVINSFGGQVISSSFFIGNNEEEPLIIEIETLDWRRDEFGNLVFEEPNTHPRSIASWIEFDPKQFVLGPDSSQEINFTVTVPQEATGSYWGGFLADVKTETAAQQEEEGVGVQIGTKFLIKIFIETQAGSNRDGDLIKVQRLGLNPLTIAISFRNTGNIRLQDVLGRVEIRDLQGNTIRSMTIDEFSVLPSDTRTIEVIDGAARGDTLAPGRYLVLVILDFGVESLLGGQLLLDIGELDLVPIGDTNIRPQDLNEDGYFEDINGDDQFDSNDVALFQKQLSSDEVQLNWRAFDFNNDGTVNDQDVSVLRDALE